MMNVLKIVLLGLFMATSVSSLAIPYGTWINEQTQYGIKVEGDYHNLHYGFSVPTIEAIPAYRSVAPNSEHGIFYLLGNHRRISVWADYDVLFLGSLSAHKKNFISSRALRKVHTKAITVAGEPALLLRGKESNGYLYAILQYREQGTGILYYLVLQTDQQHKDVDRATLLRIAGKFHWESL